MTKRTRRSASPSPVVALTMLDGGSLANGRATPSSKLLAVVRWPDTNPTHPNVVSVPTHRVTAGLWEELRATASPAGRTPDAVLYSARDVSNLRANSHNPVALAVDLILAKKLGLGDALVKGIFSYRAGVRLTTSGVVAYETPNPYGPRERIRMLGIRVVVTAGAELLPLSTASYSPILWVGVGEFLRSVDTKDPSDLGPEFDPFEHCIHGLCIASSSGILRHEVRPRGEVVARHT